MLKTKEEIKNWLDKHKVTNYTINDDLTIDVDGNVNISYKNLTEIPVSFNKVNGHFWCNDNKLTSLKGCPKKVKNNFYCSDNLLTALKGCPKKVLGSFVCYNNSLTSLEGLPEEINRTLYCDKYLRDTKEYRMYLINKKLRDMV